MRKVQTTLPTGLGTELHLSESKKSALQNERPTRRQGLKPTIRRRANQNGCLYMLLLLLSLTIAALPHAYATSVPARTCTATMVASDLDHDQSLSQVEFHRFAYQEAMKTPAAVHLLPTSEIWPTLVEELFEVLLKGNSDGDLSAQGVDIRGASLARIAVDPTQKAFLELVCQRTRMIVVKLLQEGMQRQEEEGTIVRQGPFVGEAKSAGNAVTGADLATVKQVNGGGEEEIVTDAEAETENEDFNIEAGKGEDEETDTDEIENGNMDEIEPEDEVLPDEMELPVELPTDADEMPRPPGVELPTEPAGQEAQSGINVNTTMASDEGSIVMPIDMAFIVSNSEGLTADDIRENFKEDFEQAIERFAITLRGGPIDGQEGQPADACPEANAICMNEENRAQCIKLLENGCTSLTIMKSCPLQFSCGDLSSGTQEDQQMPPEGIPEGQDMQPEGGSQDQGEQLIQPEEGGADLPQEGDSGGQEGAQPMPPESQEEAQQMPPVTGPPGRNRLRQLQTVEVVITRFTAATVIAVADVDCPDDADDSENTLCHVITATFNVLTNPKDARRVYNRYVELAQTEIDKGALQEEFGLNNLPFTVEKSFPKLNNNSSSIDSPSNGGYSGGGFGSESYLGAPGIIHVDVSFQLAYTAKSTADSIVAKKGELRTSIQRYLGVALANLTDEPTGNSTSGQHQGNKPERPSNSNANSTFIPENNRPDHSETNNNSTVASGNDRPARPEENKNSTVVAGNNRPDHPDTTTSNITTGNSRPDHPEENKNSTVAAGNDRPDRPDTTTSNITTGNSRPDRPKNYTDDAMSSENDRPDRPLNGSASGQSGGRPSASDHSGGRPQESGQSPEQQEGRPEGPTAPDEKPTNGGSDEPPSRRLLPDQRRRRLAITLPDELASDVSFAACPDATGRLLQDAATPTPICFEVQFSFELQLQLYNKEHVEVMYERIGLALSDASILEEFVNEDIAGDTDYVVKLLTIENYSYLATSPDPSLDYGDETNPFFDEGETIVSASTEPVLVNSSFLISSPNGQTAAQLKANPRAVQALSEAYRRFTRRVAHGVARGRPNAPFGSSERPNVGVGGGQSGGTPSNMTAGGGGGGAYQGEVSASTTGEASGGSSGERPGSGSPHEEQMGVREEGSGQRPLPSVGNGRGLMKELPNALQQERRSRSTQRRFLRRGTIWGRTGILPPDQNRRQQRYLAIQLDESFAGAEIYDFLDSSCTTLKPNDVNEGDGDVAVSRQSSEDGNCITVFGRFRVYADEEEDLEEVYQTFSKASQTLLANGTLAVLLSEVDPGTNFTVEGVSVVVDEDFDAFVESSGVVVVDEGLPLTPNSTINGDEESSDTDSDGSSNAADDTTADPTATFTPTNGTDSTPPPERVEEEKSTGTSLTSAGIGFGSTLLAFALTFIDM